MTLANDSTMTLPQAPLRGLAALTPPPPQFHRPGAGRRIVITTIGSLGDLHPYLALGLGLRARGHEAIMATGQCYRGKIEALGLGFRAVRPDCDWVTDPAVMRYISHPRWGIMRAVCLPLRFLHESYQDTLAVTKAAGADLLIGNLATYATRLVAEKLGLPWVSVMHMPMGFYSACDPPLIPGWPELSQRLHFLGPTFWGPLGKCLKWGCARSLARPWYRVRRQVGLPPATDLNPLTDGHSPLLHLALFSPLLVAKQPDWPASAVITGFPWFDQERGAGLPPALARFLEEGPPPIVFTLGTAVASDAGPFYERSIAAARLLGQRAVLILKDPHRILPRLPPGASAVDYAPFVELFPRAALIVHHGGIGTTGLAMRSGRPMLVMPCAWDQPDNAARAARLGIARVLPRHRYTPSRAAIEMRQLLDDPNYVCRAAEVAQQVRLEDGVRVACDAVEEVLVRGS
jgi:UDP:flavonoid glycosyltransferase YjiC (YdhE family)